MFKIIDGQRTDFSKETEALLEYTPLPKDIIEHLIKPQFKVSHPVPSRIKIRLANFIKQVDADVNELYIERKRAFRLVMQRCFEETEELKVFIFKYGETNQFDMVDEYEFAENLLENKFGILSDINHEYCVLYRTEDKEYATQLLNALVEEREVELDETYNSIQALYAY